MDEKVMNQVVGDYAIENANLRITIAELQAEIVKLKGEQEHAETGK
ncbi:MAG: hypothetical protein PT939_04935 [Aerococcus suis]|nr:hypothetical protein [Aerococcus suis]